MQKDKNPANYTACLIDSLRATGTGLVFDCLNERPYCFSGDGLAVFGRNLGFLSDELFVKAFKLALNRFEVPEITPILESIVWKKHIVCSLASQALHIDGDFVECGVEWGFGIDVAAHYLDFQKIKKNWYLYDTFLGVPLESKDEGFEISGLITKTSQFERVKAKFSHLKNIKIVQGMLPEILNTESPSKIAFLHIDLNNVVGEIATFSKLYPHVSIGGIILFDDYGSLLFAKQHAIEREFFSRLGLSITELPTGQAFIVKTKEVEFDVDVSDILAEYSFEKYIAHPQTYSSLMASNTKNAQEDATRLFEYFRSQLEYILRFSAICDSPELSKQLRLIHQKYLGQAMEHKDESIKYTSVIDFDLKRSNEIAFDIQNKINLLQSIIDNECK